MIKPDYSLKSLKYILIVLFSHTMKSINLNTRRHISRTTMLQGIVILIELQIQLAEVSPIALNSEVITTSSNHNHIDILSECIDGSTWADQSQLGQQAADVSNSEVISDRDYNPIWEPPGEFVIHENPTSRNFRIIAKNVTCSHDQTSLLLNWHSSTWSIDPSLHGKAAKISFSNVSFSPEGSLIWLKNEQEKYTFSKEDFCIARKSNDWLAFKVCIPKCSSRNPCSRKCCPPSQILDEETRRCVSGHPDWHPEFSPSHDLDTTEVIHTTNSTIGIAYGYPDCLVKYKLESGPVTKFKLLYNGSLIQVDTSKKDKARHILIDEGEFCIDGMFLRKPWGKDGISSRIKEVVIACAPTAPRL